MPSGGPGRAPHGPGPSGDDGIEATRRIREASPGTKVVGAHRRAEPSLIISAMAAGACGYMSKTRAADALVDVVRRAASGEIEMSDDGLPILLDELRTGRESTVVAELALRRLTARDTEILRALASGEATGEIADELGISPLTVQSHVKSIPTKLGVHSKIEARRGWSELDEEVRPALVRRIQQVASDLARQAPATARGIPAQVTIRRCSTGSSCSPPGRSRSCRRWPTGTPPRGSPSFWGSASGPSEAT